jgi:hypothetical protein
MTPAEADALRRRLLRLAALLGVALVAVLVNAALSSGGGGDGPANPIRAAAARTEREAGGHAAIEMLFTVVGQTPLVATGHAVFDFSTGRSRASLVGPGGEFGKDTIRAYADRDAGFVSSPGYQAMLPPGLRWISNEPWLGGSTRTALPGRWNPADQVRMMRAADEIEDLGEQEVLGVETERYGGRVDLRDYAANLSDEGDRRGATEFRRLAKLIPTTVRVEAWVDAAGRLRRVRTVTTLPPTDSGEPPETVDVRADLMAYGEVTVPPPPPAAETLDVSPLLRWQDGLLEPRSIALATGRPLSAGTFHRRATAICTRFEGIVERQTRRAQSTGDALRKLSEAMPPGRAAEERLRRAYQTYFRIYYAPLERTIRRYLDRLGSLASPTADAAKWERLLQISSEQEALLTAALRAGQAGDFELFKEIGDAQKPFERRSEAINRSLGLPKCIGKGDSGSETEPAHEAQPSID